MDAVTTFAEANGLIGTQVNGYSAASSNRPFPTCAGKVALVTGSSRGIGAGIALELGSRGASVVVNYLTNGEGAEEVVHQLQKLGSQAISIQADVSKPSEISRLFAAAESRFGRIDIVVSNSGMECFEKIENITEELYDRVFNLNVRAQFFVAQHAYKYCVPGGRLILMSSIAAGLISIGDHSLYSGSKMAINGFVKSFAKDFGDKQITVNAIAPGAVKSEMSAKVAWRYIPGATSNWPTEKVESAIADATPLCRFGLPVDIGRVVAFLASDDGGWVNGKYTFTEFGESINADSIPQVKLSQSLVEPDNRPDIM